MYLFRSFRKPKLEHHYKIIDETIELPLSFIVGSSFILGSIFGSFIDFDSKND